jgi:redox-sensitive bicupin YhaK (pirin superfamily)
MSDAILGLLPLGMPWPTPDPFLFCVHHVDAYPKGDERMAPATSLAGRDLGQDFSGKAGFSMYHGLSVPGFPQHPHRGFETVTVVRRGLVDHADSAGATARYGHGDVQWLTAGRGINHSEMFPLVSRDDANPMELFQIWLNLPRAGKMAAPHFTMFWKDDVPQHVATDASGRKTMVTLIAGALEGVTPPTPPPDSWASREASDVAIWTIHLEPNATWTLPATRQGTNRYLYFFAGQSLSFDGDALPSHCAAALRADLAVRLDAGPDGAELLMLQGRPIGEPVVQHGPFVMTSREEILQTIADYRRTGFGGWPWPDDAPVHPRDEGRFARHANGREERPHEG